MAGNVRQNVDVSSLKFYLADHVSQILTPIELQQFGFGESNPTYSITASNGQKFVLRKRPRGVLSPVSHRVDCEYRILRALEHTDVLTPKTYLFCSDETVIGTSFYIMEFVDGRIFANPSMPGIEAAERTQMWHSAVQALAKLHIVDFSSIGLQMLSKSSGFYSRQLATLTTLSASQAKPIDKATGNVIGEPRDRAVLIHGDYKIDNLVFHRIEPRVIGILDWEMATIGHPLSDFVNLTQPYAAAQYHTYVGFNEDAPDFKPGTLAGLPLRQQCMDWYAEVTGWNPQEDIRSGDAFCASRLAVVLQGIAARHAAGQSGSAKAAAYGLQRNQNALWAFSLVKGLINSSTPNVTSVPHSDQTQNCNNR